MGSALASNESIRLSLPDGDFITVKKELNAGEVLDLQDESGNQTLATVIAYLIGWSLVGPDDVPILYNPVQPVAERRDTVRALKASTLEAITDALLPHIKAQRQIAAEKKTIPPVEVGSV